MSATFHPSNSEPICISLPSLIHRIGREAVKQAQGLALQYQCELKRVRRSRNWSLTGQAREIQSFIATLKACVDAEKFHYLLKKGEAALLQHGDKLEPLDAKLVRLLAENPNLTLGELMALTDCTLAQARLARFQFDE